MSMLKEQIQKDLSASLKSGDQFKRLTLSTLLSALKNKELQKRTQLSATVSEMAVLEKQSQLTDEEAQSVIAGEVKKRRDAAEQFKIGHRPDLADKEEKEITILMSFLPQPLGEPEIKKMVSDAIVELGAVGPKDVGRVIGVVMTRAKNRAEGSLVGRLVKEALVK